MWLLDRFPNIRYYVDLHSYGETILHSWGSDENQSDNPRMSFRNRAYDGKRGLIHDNVYREYIPAADERTAIEMGRHMAAAIQLRAGTQVPGQAVGGPLPDRRLLGRLRLQPPLRRSEEGQDHRLSRSSGAAATPPPFHPPYAEMRKVMREVSAGLLALLPAGAGVEGEEKEAPGGVEVLPGRLSFSYVLL